MKEKSAPEVSTRATCPVTIVAGQPELWTTFLTDMREAHPAWVILLQGLALEHPTAHTIHIDKHASQPIAVAWLQDRQQIADLKAAYHAAVGQPLTIGSAERDAHVAAAAPVEQTTLEGITPPPTWTDEAAGALKQFFPDATIRTDTP